MSGIDNPVECQTAERCLAEHCPLDAARALLGSVQPAHPEVRRLLQKTAAVLVADASRLFDSGEWKAAAERIETAARCDRLSPADENLRHLIAIRCGARGDDAPSTETTATRSTLLSGLSSYGDVLIIPRSTILVGMPNQLSVDLALQGVLREHHALLVCDQSHNEPAHWSVLPLGPAVVLVDEEQVEPGRCRRLKDEQIVQFGQPTCRWLFRFPDDRHATAVLEVARPSPARALANGRSAVSTVVLGVGAIAIGRTRDGCHLVHRRFPIARLELAPSLVGWRVAAPGADDSVLVDGRFLSDVAGRPHVAPLEIQVNDDCFSTAFENVLHGVRGDVQACLRLW